MDMHWIQCRPILNYILRIIWKVQVSPESTRNQTRFWAECDKIMSIPMRGSGSGALIARVIEGTVIQKGPTGADIFFSGPGNHLHQLLLVCPHQLQLACPHQLQLVCLHQLLLVCLHQLRLVSLQTPQLLETCPWLSSLQVLYTGRILIGPTVRYIFLQ